jgi:hypothetical protein
MALSAVLMSRYVVRKRLPVMAFVLGAAAVSIPTRIVSYRE